MNSETKNCQSCKNPFVIEPDDFGFYEQMKVPPPTWCPQCRLIRRLNWQGCRVLYKRKCDFTGETVISTYHPDSLHEVYKQDIWWSDKWDPLSYGRDFDPSKPFLEQYAELLKAVPHPSLSAEYTSMIQSEYSNAASNLKNCYLCFRISGGEDSAYLNTIVDAKQCFDSSFLNHSELCYGDVRVNKCYRTFFSENCDECHDVWFSKNLSSCTDCVGSINLRNKQYCIFNKQYSKDEYQKELKKFDFGTRAGMDAIKKQAEEFMSAKPRRQFHGIKNLGVTGDYISNSKNVKDSYLLNNGDDLRYCQFLKDGPASRSYDWSYFGDGAEFMYDCCWSGWNARNNKFGAWNYGAHDIEFCFGCHNSGNLFGCVGVRKGEYCILNKKYSKEEYQKLVTQIKDQMMKIPYRDRLGREYRYGEMLPTDLCPWAYNESAVHEWFPLSKEEAIKQGFRWRDPDPKEYKEATMKIPEHIKDVSDDILKAVLKCEECGKNYLIIPMELQFLRRFNLPIPHQCSSCRDRIRIQKLNPMTIHDRICAKCGKEIETSYAPERPEIVYCESCYQQEVV